MWHQDGDDDSSSRRHDVAGVGFSASSHWFSDNQLKATYLIMGDELTAASFVQ
jgi:hypothetical protein